MKLCPIVDDEVIYCLCKFQEEICIFEFWPVAGYVYRPVAETYIIYILLIYTIRPIKFFFYCFGQKLQFIFFGQIYLLYVSAKKKVWSCKLLECNPGLSLLWIMDIPLFEGGFVICSFFFVEPSGQSTKKRSWLLIMNPVLGSILTILTHHKNW